MIKRMLNLRGGGAANATYRRYFYIKNNRKIQELNLKEAGELRIFNKKLWKIPREVSVVFFKIYFFFFILEIS